MAKQQSKQQPATPQARKQAKPSPSGFSYLWRNLALAAALAILIFSFDSIHAKRGRLEKLGNEFNQLRQMNGNQQRMRELYDEIMTLQQEVQADTGYLSKRTSGYHFAVHTVAIGGRKGVAEMKEHIKAKTGKDEITREDILAERIAPNIWAIVKQIEKTTPENAVIYLPNGDASISNNSQWNYIYDPEWMEYFLYPRLCVTIGNEKNHPDLAKRVTHVIIVEGKGYDKLRYHVPEEQRVQTGVFPIDSATFQTEN